MIDKREQLRMLLNKMIVERPERKGNAEGKIILHFDTNGDLKKLEEINYWSSYNMN